MSIKLLPLLFWDIDMVFGAKDVDIRDVRFLTEEGFMQSDLVKDMSGGAVSDVAHIFVCFRLESI
jgi:hypothetical protein